MSTQKILTQPSLVTPFLFLGALSTFSLLSFDLYQPALPSITAYFNTTQAIGQLTLSLFFFAFGFSQLIWGPLIDHFGRKRTLRLSLICFFIATLGCIFSKNILMLIIARIFQGFSVCCASVVAFSSSRDQEDSTDRARVLSHISMIISVSPIFAPLLGAIIFSYLGWRATFIFMGIICIILFTLAEKVLHESPHWVKSDIGFLWQTSWINYKKILSNKHLWINIVLVTASYSCVMIMVINTAYLIIDNLNYSPFYFSIFFASNGITLILGNYLGIRLREKKSLAWNIRLASIVMTLGSILMVILFAVQGLTLISLTPSLLVNLGVSLLNPPVFSIALSDYPQQAGTATAIMNTIRMTCSAIIGGSLSLLIAKYTHSLAWSMLICSVICLLFSVFINEPTKQQ